MHLYLTHDFDGDSNEISDWINNLTVPNLFKLLSAKDAIDSNPFMSSVFYGKYTIGIKVLELLDKSQRKDIVMNLNSFGSNVLHIAASRGYMEFLTLFKQKFSSWGLLTEDIINMITQKEVHEAIPIEMAYFQNNIRGRDRAGIVSFFSIWMCELGVYVPSPPHQAQIFAALLPDMYNMQQNALDPVVVNENIFFQSEIN